jgi:hypothetical protein
VPLFKFFGSIQLSRQVPLVFLGGLDYTVKLKPQREGAIWNLLKSALSAWAVWATNMQKT